LFVTGATSVTTTGRYRSNMTETKYITTYNSASLNQGGAVYMSSNAGRLMLRGGQDVQIPMQMSSNSSARGGAIYSEENFSIRS
jgi:predicted outer membrane repeat protein